MRKGRFMIGSVGLATALLLGVEALPALAATPPNLIADQGAEAAKAGTGGVVAIPKWTRSTGTKATAVKYGSPGFPTATSPGPNVREKNFFAGGPADPDFGNEVLTQTVTVPAGAVSDVDAGKATFH